MRDNSIAVTVHSFCIEYTWSTDIHSWTWLVHTSKVCNTTVQWCSRTTAGHKTHTLLCNMAKLFVCNSP